MAAPTKLRVGDTVGPYTLVREIGRGAMATVFEASRAEGKNVALKVLRPVIEHQAELRERFEREGRILQALRHENIARVYDVGALPDGVLYLVIDLLEGCDLGSMLETTGLLSLGSAVKCVLEAAYGVGEAHAHGIVHRDLKPANIFLAKNRSGQEVVKVLDFGVAKVLGAVPSQERAQEVIGSPHYMAPEQLRGSAAVTPQTDVWALGVVLYRALTDTFPFDAPSLNELLRTIREASPRPLRVLRPDCPPELDDIVRRCLAKDPLARFPDANALADALAPFAAEEYDDVTRVQEESTRFMPVAREMQRRSAIASLAGLPAAPDASGAYATISSASVSIVTSVPSFTSFTASAAGSISAVAATAPSAPVAGGATRAPTTRWWRGPHVFVGMGTRGPWAIVAGATLALFLVAGGVGLVVLGRGGWNGRPGSVKVRVTSQPEGALFTLDYGTQMTAPGELTVRRDDRAHILTVWKEGYRPETRDVSTASDSNIEIKLVPLH